MTESKEMGDPGEAALSEGTRQRMEGVRRGLLRLHKTLLDSERAAYEQVYGRVSPGDLLQLLINNQRFAWLRPFSEMVVQIDEMLEADRDSEEAATEQGGVALLQQVRLLLTPTETETDASRRYHDALQKDPATVLAHAEIVKLLPAAG
ncbi:MAG: hypothetical protein V4671_29375 [Armatimonadota bacterium]